MAHAYNVSTWEARLEDCREFEAGLDYRVRPSAKTATTKIR